MARVKKALTMAKTENLRFDIIGYKDSDQNEHDYRGLVFAGHEGYIRLVQESIDWTNKRKTHVPAWCGEQNVWDAATDKQTASWRKTLEGGHGRKQQELDVQEDGAWSTDKARPGIVILKSMELTGEHTESGAQTDKTPKSMEARCTAYLRRMAPVGRFVGQLNLAAGKFAHIVVHAPPHQED